MKKNILLYMPAVYHGGAETQFRYLVSELNKESSVKLYVIIENSDEHFEEFAKENSNVTFISFSLNYLNQKPTSRYISIITSLKSNLIAVFKSVLFLIKHRDINYCVAYDGIGSRLFFLMHILKIKTIFSERVDGTEIVKRWINRKNLKNASAVYANSISGSSFLRDKLNRNVPVIFNGIQTDESAQVKTIGNEFSILVVSRVNKLKNIFTIVKAIREIQKIQKVKLVICGKIEDQLYYNEMCDYIKNNQLENDVLFIGYTKDIKNFYKEADLVVLASYHEGMPNAILESYANKRIVLASNIEMNTAIVQNKKFIFDPNSPKELSNKIEMVMTMTEEEKSELVKKNYEFVKSDFGVSQMATNFLHLLESID